ncbi:hypothetical protein BO71DRAFT_319374 [Aspergillus ellipticus CBS 707.79]|uniref:F-box domain-containing protein n=1 Tax=Aspergillus ellipticus CBS 707.79 TaxID=1448320 RepID=A0A319EYQ4_9EURO|nr:hypothetical protein BO71DRAFT_319374 [Aspergillus ellipticus CBS 707.79]
MSPGSSNFEIPADVEIDRWGSGDLPPYHQTDLYLFHDQCWDRLVEHFSPQEFDLDCIFNALERLPLPPSYPWYPTNCSESPLFKEMAFNGRYGLPSIEELMRFAKARPKPLHTTEKIPLLSSPHDFQRLSVEMIEYIAALLPTRDALNLRQASRAVAPIFFSSAFWKTRFDINGERGFILPILRDLIRTEQGQEFDWRLLYHCTCRLNCSAWFHYERRCWEALRWLRDTALALHSGKSRPLDFRGNALNHYHNTRFRDTYTEAVTIDSPVCQIAISAHKDMGGLFVTGLEFFFKDRPKALIGYTLPGAKQLSAREYGVNPAFPHFSYPGIRVTLDVVEIHGIAVSPTFEGISGVCILQGHKYWENLYNQNTSWVGYNSHSLPVVNSVSSICLDEIEQIFAVANSRKVLDLGILGRAERRVKQWPEGEWEKIVNQCKDLGYLPAHLELW